jgi:hypothetical protein
MEIKRLQTNGRKITDVGSYKILATMTPSDAAKAAASHIRRKVLTQMASGIGVVSVPVAVWWYLTYHERQAKLEDVRTRVRVPNVQDTDDLLVEKCQAGDVILFDRRCEKVAAGPWAAISCLASRTFLCDDKKLSSRTVAEGKFDHIGKSSVWKYR